MSNITKIDMKLEVVTIPVSDVDTGDSLLREARLATGRYARRLWCCAVHPACLRVLGAVRRQPHVGQARVGRGPLPDRLRHSRHQRCASRRRRRSERTLPSRPRRPDRRAGTGPPQLPVPCVVQRPGPQSLAAPGSDEPATRAARPWRDVVRVHRRPRGRPTASFGGTRRAREAGRWGVRRELARLVCREGADFLGRFMERQAGRDAPTSDAARDAQYDAVNKWGVPDHSALQCLTGVKSPTLVLQGDNDLMIPTKLSYLMAGLIPHARVRIYPDGRTVSPFSTRARPQPRSTHS